jgi:hypothetical protein
MDQTPDRLRIRVVKAVGAVLLGSAMVFGVSILFLANQGCRRGAPDEE